MKKKQRVHYINGTAYYARKRKLKKGITLNYWERVERVVPDFYPCRICKKTMQWMQGGVVYHGRFIHAKCYNRL